jgi:hypothetical protein
MQAATAERSDPRVDLQGIPIDEFVVDEVLEEMAIATVLHLETQRWLVARCMTAVSLAASMAHDEDYYRALAALGDAPADGEELEFARALLAQLVADLKETFAVDASTPGQLGSDFERRLADQDALLGLLAAH